MKVKVGTKVTTPMPNGLRWPAIVISEETSEKVTVINRSTQLPVEITVTRADVLSLRETREGEKYPAVTTEVIQYGYRPVAEPRFSNVIGLDVDADGTLRTLEQNLEEHGESYSAWQAANFAARRGAVAAEDI